MQKTWTGYWNIDTHPPPPSHRTPQPHLRNVQNQFLYTTNFVKFYRILSFLNFSFSWVWTAIELPVIAGSGWTSPVTCSLWTKRYQLIGMGWETHLVVTAGTFCHLLLYVLLFSLHFFLFSVDCNGIENIQFITLALNTETCNTFFSLIPIGQCWAMRTCGLGPQRTELDYQGMVPHCTVQSNPCF